MRSSGENSCFYRLASAFLLFLLIVNCSISHAFKIEGSSKIIESMPFIETNIRNDFFGEAESNVASVFNPQILLEPDSITLNLNACNDSLSIPIKIFNTGDTTLNYSILKTSFVPLSDTVEILSFNYGVDLSAEFPGITSAISANFSKFHLTTINSTSAIDLQQALIGKNVLLFPRQSTGLNNFYADIAAVVQNFADNGGTVILCGSTPIYENRPFELGLFSGSYLTTSLNGYLDVTNNTDPITAGLINTIVTQSTYYYDITNSDVVKLVEFNNFDVVCYRNFGAGEVILVGFDYDIYLPEMSQIISNCIQLPTTSSEWVNLSSTSGNILAGDSIIISVAFSSGKLSAGTYYPDIIVSSNDVSNPSDTIHCTLNINTNPCADFNIIYPVDCSGTIRFEDNSINDPTSWLWTFGDGSTSNIAEPTHVYTIPGIYPVSLMVCNSNSCNTIIRSVEVTNVGAPAPASCVPITLNNCCGMGIKNVKLNTIDNSSWDGSVGYEDFTCEEGTTLLLNHSYMLKVQTGPTYSENVMAWIDFNNNGTFESNENVYTSIAQIAVDSALISIPNNAITNLPLRFRIGSDDFTSGIPSDCGPSSYGQYEDYTIVLQETGVAPVTNFALAILDSCDGIVTFHDLSSNLPTNWNWSFGDGSISSLQNPTHAYQSSGTYTVSLVSQNIYGSSSFSLNVTISPFVATTQIEGNNVTTEQLHFVASAPGAVSCLWNFGDSTTSDLFDVYHSYNLPGTYIVSCTIDGTECTATVYDTLEVKPNSLDDEFTADLISIYPNPFIDFAEMSYEIKRDKSIKIELIDVLGQVVQTIADEPNQKSGRHKYTIRLVSGGVYFIRMQVDNELFSKRLVKLK